MGGSCGQGETASLINGLLSVCISWEDPVLCVCVSVYVCCSGSILKTRRMNYCTSLNSSVFCILPVVQCIGSVQVLITHVADVLSDHEPRVLQ